MKKLFSILLIFPSFLLAQSEQYQLGGYAKYLFSSADQPVIGRINDNILHSRINGKLFLSEGITAAAELRNRIFWGGSVQKIPGFLSTITSDHDFGNTDVVWWNTASSVAHSELDRFYIDAAYEHFQLTVGRQRVAWGTALVWNPTDLFNPLSILDFDYEERPGIDAVRLQYFSSEVSKIEIAVKPGRTHSRSAIAGKILMNQWGYDFHLLGGMHGGDPFFGASWAGDIADAGFRGEVVTKKISDESKIFFPPIRKDWSSTFVLSADYTFRNNSYLHTEILFNQVGVTDNAAAFRPASLSMGLLSPARWSVFQEFSFDAHPLVRVSGFYIFNPNDNSAAFVPSATWSVVENVDVSFFGLIFSGKTTTEYGGYGQSLFIRGKLSF